MEKLILEKSSNTHVLESPTKIVNQVTHESGVITVTTSEPNAFVTHGEHGTIAVETKTFHKTNLKEFNPLSRKIMNAID